MDNQKKSRSIRFLWWALLPITGPLWLVGWILTGGAKVLWDEFLAHLFMDVDYDEKGQPKEVFFLEASPFIHFHPLTWGSWILAGVLANLDPVAFKEARDWAGLGLVALTILCAITVFADLPFKKFVVAGLGVLVVLPLADFGLAKIAEQADQFLIAQDWPRLLAFAEDGALTPAWEYLRWLDTGVDPGFIILFSIPWTGIVVCSLVWSFLEGRYGFDGNRLIRWKYGEGDDSMATYYADARVGVPDVLEWLSGFGSLTFGNEGDRRGHKVIRNIFFLGLRSRRKIFEAIIFGKKMSPGDTEGNEGPDGAKEKKLREADDAHAADD